MTYYYSCLKFQIPLFWSFTKGQTTQALFHFYPNKVLYEGVGKISIPRGFLFLTYNSIFSPFFLFKKYPLRHKIVDQGWILWGFDLPPGFGIWNVLVLTYKNEKVLVLCELFLRLKKGIWKFKTRTVMCCNYCISKVWNNLWCQTFLRTRTELLQINFHSVFLILNNKAVSFLCSNYA